VNKASTRGRRNPPQEGLTLNESHLSALELAKLEKKTTSEF
jgi:hypothetical protein